MLSRVTLARPSSTGPIRRAGAGQAWLLSRVRTKHYGSEKALASGYAVRRFRIGFNADACSSIRLDSTGALSSLPLCSVVSGSVRTSGSTVESKRVGRTWPGSSGASGWQDQDGNVVRFTAATPDPRDRTRVLLPLRQWGETSPRVLAAGSRSSRRRNAPKSVQSPVGLRRNSLWATRLSCPIARWRNVTIKGGRRG